MFRIINFFMLLVLFSVSLGTNAQPCGIQCLSASDKQLLGQARNTTRNLLSEFKSLEKERGAQTPATAALVLRRSASWLKEYYEDYRDYRRRTENIPLANYYLKLSRSLQELSETCLAGAAVLDAIQANNASLLQGVGEAIAYGEARKLVGPVASNFELQARANAFQSLFERKSIQMERDLDAAWDELKKSSGIEF